ncbi:MAG TPA: hypothetical protein VFU47_08460, partial [Armatimonadota bacterium]|nr:hypothetical protein [Armatimonadota bacterium]
DLYGATRDHNPRAKEMIEGPLQAGPQGMLKVGGLMSTGTATETGPLTMRNAITWYCNLAAGGVWPESSDYNLVTPQLLMVGVRAVETSIGPGYFPEVNAVLPDLAAHHLLSHTSPLFSGSYQWGDVERLRYLWITHRLTVSGMYAGMLADERVGPWLQQFTEELTRFPGDASEPVTSGQYPYTPFFLLFDPYAPKADWRNSLPSSSYGRTMGLLLQRSGGWSDNSSLFGAQAAAATGVDHEVTYFADFQLWRKGEWAVTHPLGWGWWNQRSTGDGANSMLIGGLGAMSEARGPVAEEIGPNDEFSYLAGATGGQFLQQGFNDGPAIYLHEWTRSTVYLPSRDGHSDTIVVYDRVNAEDPRKLYGYARYAEHNWDRAMKPALENYPVKQWFIHMPVEPTLTADAISWSTPKGQMVRVNTLLPADQRRKVVNEKTLWYAGDQLAFADRERKWQVRVVPGQERQWDTFLNVVQAFDGGAALSNTLVRSAGGEAEGVTVHRGSHPDTLLMFGAVPSPKLKQPPLAATYVIKHDRSLIRLLGTRRLLHQGYRASWTAGAGSTELLLFDLDPAQGWRVKIDEQPAVPLKVSRSGLARITAEGTGEHSLALSTDVKPAN